MANPKTPKQPTQEQLFHKAHREVNDTLQQAAWMAGKMPDSQGRWNPNPMNDQEIHKAANSQNPTHGPFSSFQS